MNEIPNEIYYTIILPSFIVALPIIYFALALLWNRKWAPRQRMRGQIVQPFGMIVGNALRLGFREDNFKLLKKVDNKFANKFLSLKGINWLLVLATITLILLKNDNFWIPLLLVVLSIAIRTTPIINQRKQILNRMFAVASSVFRYGRGSDLEPWKYVRIKKWETFTTPGETHVSIPATFDTSGLMSRDGFERHFNSTVTDENSWVYEWKGAEGTVICRPINHLPTMAEYPGSEKHPWHVIPLGIGSEGEVTVDLTKTPHMLVCGSTGSGKSVLQRNLLFHCIQHNDSWRFLGVDVKRVELTPFKRYTQTVLGIGANLEDGVDVVRYVKKVMDTRYERMEEMGVNHFSNMVDEETGKPPYAIMLMVDEAFMFMSPEGAKSDEGKVRDQLHAEASTLLGDIARLGRAAGIHLVLATQRPDATVIKGELKANLDIRIAAGRLDSTPSSMVLDSGAATQLPGHIKGRGIVRFGGEQYQFQGYFAPQEWIDQWLEQHPGVEPELYPAVGGSKSPSLMGELADLGEDFNFDDAELDSDVLSDDENENSDSESVLFEESTFEDNNVNSGITEQLTVNNLDDVSEYDEVTDDINAVLDKFFGPEGEKTNPVEESPTTSEKPSEGIPASSTPSTPNTTQEDLKPSTGLPPLTKPNLPKLPPLPPINKPSLPPLPPRSGE